MPGALEQILDNLVDNSLAVAPPSSAIELSVRRGEQAVEVSVADRGPGMTPEQIARSFDRFWRAADADHPGTGLGLAVVQQLAGPAAATSAWPVVSVAAWWRRCASPSSAVDASAR